MNARPEKIRDLDLMDAVNRANLRRSLRVLMEDPARTLRFLAARPSLIPAGIRLHLHQKHASAIRRNEARTGLDVPVMMLISITSRCSLDCAGCYMKQRPVKEAPELTRDELIAIVGQAEALGISVIGITGGEPLERRDDVIALARSFPRILFTLNTNGLLIDEATAADLATCENLIPFISLEGLRDHTDKRRGGGMYERLLPALLQLNRHVLFFGCAVTVTRENADEVFSGTFIRTLLETGARALVFIQYVPAEPGTEDRAPTPEQRERLVKSMDDFNRNYPAFFIGIPGDMKVFGGCLAAGRGFVHVNPYGDLEPCPMVPLSDANLRTVPLRDALQSHLLISIRNNHHTLHADGRCLLRVSPEQVLDTARPTDVETPLPGSRTSP